MSRELCRELADWMEGDMAFYDAEDEFRSAMSNIVISMIHGDRMNSQRDAINNAIDTLITSVCSDTIWRLLLAPLEQQQGELEYKVNPPENGRGISLSMISGDDELKRVELAPLVVACVDSAADFANSEYDSGDESWKERVRQIKLLRESLAGLVSHIDATLAAVPSD